MNVGDEVVINIAPEYWDGEYYRALSGKSGILSKYLGKSLWEVTFKAPVKMPHSYYLMHNSYMAESLKIHQSYLVPYVKQVRLMYTYDRTGFIMWSVFDTIGSTQAECVSEEAAIKIANALNYLEFGEVKSERRSLPHIF